MSSRILVGTSDGIREIGKPDELRAAGTAVDHLVATPAGLWAVLDGHDVWHDANGEGNPAATPIASERANCVLPYAERVLVGASDAALFEHAGGELERVASFDEAPGRSTWYTPWGGPPDVRSVAAGVEGTLFVNVHVGGILRSTDGGASWVETMDIHADVHQVVADPSLPGRAYAATARGLAVTITNGDSWEFTTDGLHAPYCRAVAANSHWLFLSASGGPGGRQAALFRRRRDGGGLERCTSGLPEWFTTNLNTFCLDARDDLVVAGDASGTIFTSTDDGASWSVVADNLPEVRCLTLA